MGSRICRELDGSMGDRHGRDDSRRVDRLFVKLALPTVTIQQLLMLSSVSADCLDSTSAIVWGRRNPRIFSSGGRCSGLLCKRLDSEWSQETVLHRYSSKKAGLAFLGVPYPA